MRHEITSREGQKPHYPGLQRGTPHSREALWRTGPIRQLRDLDFWTFVLAPGWGLGFGEHTMLAVETPFGWRNAAHLGKVRVKRINRSERGERSGAAQSSDTLPLTSIAAGLGQRRLWAVVRDPLTLPAPECLCGKCEARKFLLIMIWRLSSNCALAVGFCLSYLPAPLVPY